jgi:hypothetical protein
VICPVDRGSCIVGTRLPDLSIALQAPRGTLGTIPPRHLVILENFNVRAERVRPSVYNLSGQQRIDLNVLVDANPDEFCSTIASCLCITRSIRAVHLHHVSQGLEASKQHTSRNGRCDGSIRGSGYHHALHYSC